MWPRLLRGSAGIDAAVVALCGLVLVGSALARPVLPHGDSGEYLLMAESWAQHGSPELRPQDVSSLEERARQAGVAFDRSQVLGNYFQGADDRSYCYHFWGYSLLTLPARFVLRAFGADELRAGPLTNAIVLSGTLVAVLFLSVAPLGARRAGAALLATSPVLGFVRWPHPEVLSFSMAALALVFLRRGNGPAAVACASVASMQSPPFAILAVVLVFLFAGPALRARRWRSAAGLFAAAVPALLSPIFFYMEFRTLSLAAYETAGVAGMSVHKTLDLLFDLNLGMLPYLPVTLALFLWCAARIVRRPRSVEGLLLATLVVMMVACTATGNWNHGTSGPSRYLVWVLPVIYDLIVRPGAPRTLPPVVLLVSVAAQALALVLRGGLAPPLDYLDHSYAARFVLDRWPALYRPEPEVFAERTRHTERDVDAPTIYVRDARCRKALARWKHGPEVALRCGPWPSAARAFFEGRPPKSEKGTWVYVDY